MKKMLLASVLLMGSVALAKNDPSNDFSASSNEIKQISVDELTWRMHVTGEIFAVSSNGEKLVNVANETREWEFSGETSLMSNWVFQSKGQPLVAIAHEWKIQSDGRVTVELKHYDSIARGSGTEVKYGKLLKEESFVIKNFGPIETTVASGAQKLVVRLTPGVWNQDEALDVGKLPLTGKNIVIYDSKGNVWADGVEGDRPSTYFGAVTHQGAVFLSFVPFKGAKLLGNAKNGRIKLKIDNGNVYLLSEMPFTPRNVKLNVYGIIKQGLRTERAKSVRTYSSDKEEAFLERLGN
ncbi:MAG: hypothetical protein V4760_08630 [Bdellovibrionota bacterium]